MKIQQELTKLYYSIGEISELFDVSASLLRYWESEFQILRPAKNRKGDRRYTKKDIQQIEQIYTLVKERGFTLDGAKKELKALKSKPKNPQEDTLKKLIQLRKKISSLYNKL